MNGAVGRGLRCFELINAELLIESIIDFRIYSVNCLVLNDFIFFLCMNFFFFFYPGKMNANWNFPNDQDLKLAFLFQLCNWSYAN